MCEYDGPSDFDSGTLASFRVINESSEEGGFVILQFVGDPAFDDFVQVMSEEIADGSGPPPESSPSRPFEIHWLLEAKWSKVWDSRPPGTSVSFVSSRPAVSSPVRC